MISFTISFTTPDPNRQQPLSPIDLDPGFIFHQITDGGATNAGKGRILLKCGDGDIHEFAIVEVRPLFDADGNQESYEMFVV